MKASAWLDRLSARDRRAIALGLAVLTPALLWTAVVRPWREAVAVTRGRIESERALLAREENLLAAAPSLPDSLRAAESAADRAANRLVQAPNIALAEAGISDQLERLAESSRVLLQEIRTVQANPDEAPGLRTIRLGIRGESDLNGVTTLLHRLEGGPLLLRVQEMQIEPVMERPRAVARGRTNAPPAEPQATGVVRFQLILDAYALAEPAARTAGRPEESP